MHSCTGGRRTTMRHLQRASLAIALSLVAAAAGGRAAIADDGHHLRCAPPNGESAFDLSLRGLTGPGGADLELSIAQAPQSTCAVPETLEKIKVKIYHLDGKLASKRTLEDLAAPGGAADIGLGTVGRGQIVSVTARVEAAASSEKYELRGITAVLLRPDLVVEETTAPRIVFATRSFSVTARIAELNGDVGASATVTLSEGSTALGSVPVTVAPGGGTQVNLDGITLTGPGLNDLTLTVDGATTAETDVTNNLRRAPIDVVTAAVSSSQVLAAGLGGYGAHMNQNVYAAITGAPADVLGDLESKVIAQRPAIVRVFYNDAQARAFPDRLQSFYKTLQLAQRAGATINVTWQSGGIPTPNTSMTQFAAVLNTAVKTWGVTNLRWATVQNEPNSTKLLPAQIEANYRALDAKLRALGLRDQIRLMGLDLVQDDQRTWFDYAATHMNDLLDAYSIHVFWDYWDTAKLERRLKEVRAIVDALPPEARKPLYAMEYGVRGIRQSGTVKFVDPGVWDEQQQIPVTQTNVNAFQQAWFDVQSAALGYAGTVKWDSYFGKYDNGDQAYYMLGRWDDAGIWPVNPVYNVVRLLTAATRPAWNVTAVEQDSILDTRLTASYAGAGGELTVVGLDRAGGQLNGASTTLVPYAVGGLPPSTTFHLVEWNRDGDGRDVDAGSVTTDEAGVARVDVPLQAVFALTNLSPQL